MSGFDRASMAEVRRMIQRFLTGYSPTSHTHSAYSLTGHTHDYAASGHTHDYAASGHTHSADTTKVDKATLNANTILYAVTDDTPAALAVGASTFVGRKASGDIVAMTAAESQAVLAGGTGHPEVLMFALSDESTDLTTGSKLKFRMPFAFTLTGVRASASVASTSGLPTVDIKEAGSSIFSTKVTIDANEKTSVTAATAAVISDASLADDAEIEMLVDVAGTGTRGLKVTLIGTRA